MKKGEWKVSESDNRWVVVNDEREKVLAECADNAIAKYIVLACNEYSALNDRAMVVGVLSDENDELKRRIAELEYILHEKSNTNINTIHQTFRTW